MECFAKLQLFEVEANYDKKFVALIFTLSVFNGYKKKKKL